MEHYKLGLYILLPVAAMGTFAPALLRDMRRVLIEGDSEGTLPTLTSLGFRRTSRSQGRSSIFSHGQEIYAS
ncbi:hypothetical protein EXIGLDRAFT_278337 [Exidia glandulosa HHB12029]|uniref:Uncharacterized protein n=1 Tax=Exidia glandulosa HHB12029 TaxID=1314781 RepID=A0A165DKP5_EXIGL|nr:hypothetical protein EXIGLDRAFT_278337 [Exidia glandulosa HHB12029]